MIQWLGKWLVCSWLHRDDRCYPEVWVKDSTVWHCMRCHPCGEELDRLLKQIK